MLAPAAPNDPAAFLDRWRNAGALERASAQQLLTEITETLTALGRATHSAEHFSSAGQGKF